MINFTFTRNPSTKISIIIEAFGLVQPDNEVVLVGRRGVATEAVQEEGTVDSTGVANGAALDGTFFNLPEGPDAAADGVAFWIDTDDSGTAIPAGATAIVNAGGRAVEITTIAAADAPAAIATAIAAAILADAAFDIGVAAVNVVSYRLLAALSVADGVDGAQATGMAFAVTVQGIDFAEAGTATNAEAVQIQNIGDDVAALTTEVNGLFGAGSELAEMVIAANDGVLFSDLDPLLLAPIKAIAMDDAEVDATATLAANSTLPMPFGALGFPSTDATNLSAYKDHMVAISKSDRGDQGQFGSFGFMHSDQDLATVVPIAEGVARQEIMLPWLRDLAVTKKNKSHEVAAAVCMVCASNIVPFLPLNAIKVGKLEAPDDKSDFHTPGDAGTISVGLAAGLLPLNVDNGGNVRITRTVTASRRVVGTPDANYFDMQDWQVLYLFRKNAFNMTQQPNFLRAKGTVQKAEAMRRELLAIAKQMETAEMLQNVDQLADQFTFRRASDNRHAWIFEVPLNVVPGFHNKGIGEIGTTQFDLIAV